MEETEMSELVEITKKKLTEEFEKQKKVLEEQRDIKEALSKLETTYQDLMEQIEMLQNAHAPYDLLAWYIKTAGKIWISPEVVLQNQNNWHPVNFSVSGENMMQGQYRDKDGKYKEKTPMDVPTGLYKFVRMAI